MKFAMTYSMHLILPLVAGLAGGQDEPKTAGAAPLAQTPVKVGADVGAEGGWHLREMELMARIRGLEIELVQERALRLQREQEWMEFTKLLTLLPEQRRPELPAFLKGEPQAAQSAASGGDAQASPSDVEDQRRLRRAAEIKTTLRAYLRAEGVRALDLLEVGFLEDGYVGPIVARQLDENGRFLATLVADRLRLEKSRSGFTLTLVLERGYERRAGQVWPFPADHGEAPRVQPSADSQVQGSDSAEAAQRTGVLRIPLTGVHPRPWIEALPELFSASDLDRKVSDGAHNAFALRYTMNELLSKPRQGGRWRLVSLGGVVGDQWRDIHLAELSLHGQVVRRLFADRGQLSLQGDNLMFALESGAQERAGQRTPFLAGRYTLVLTRVDRGAWLGSGLPGL